MITNILEPLINDDKKFFDYLLGFLQTDGHNSKCSRGGNISIELSRIDEEILLKILQYYGYEKKEIP